jgi:hypothetical protein
MGLLCLDLSTLLGGFRRKPWHIGFALSYDYMYAHTHAPPPSGSPPLFICAPSPLARMGDGPHGVAARARLSPAPGGIPGRGGAGVALAILVWCVDVKFDEGS